MTGDSGQLSNAVAPDDDEYEEEEILVHVEFDCEVDYNIVNPNSTFKIIGIDSEKPLMQCGNKVYQGEWRDVVGTSVFLEKDDEKKKMKNVDPLFSKKPEKPLKLSCCTRKSLVLSRVFVKPKNDKEDAPSEDKTDTLEKTDESSGDQSKDSGLNNSEKTSEKMDVT